MIATCKKVEVDFLARQAAPEYRLQWSPSVGEANNCREFNDEFPDQVLKIVEDTDCNGDDASTASDSSDENDCSSSNETLVGSRASSISISD